MSFKSVSSKEDFVALEKEILDYWEKQEILDKYLHRNDSSNKKFSFLDGPKTANNALGVHHAWGRTYKDLWQRFYNMRGLRQRFQNGYDEQGLWVEVEVEKNLGLKNKKDIENIVPGDKFASLEKFINLCKERVLKYGDVITEQSKRLGQFMDWDNSYHTGSDQNNYMIWSFLKNAHERGWLYKGHDSVPWCPRCGTAISQHEMSTEDYKELTHDSVYMEYPIEGKKDEYLLVWTTTPWTLPGNVVVAVDSSKDYVIATGNVKGNKYYLNKVAAEKLQLNIEKTIKGKELVGLKYESPFDNLPRIQRSLGKYKHQVIETNPLILPISDEEGTGLVHIAPGAGTEDFQLSKKLNLPIIELIDEEANYLDGLEDFFTKNAKNVPKIILDYLSNCEDGKFLFEIVPYKHSYPVCWRCKSELVWRVVDEWYIAVDKKDSEKITFRQKMVKVAKEMNWQPKFVEKRELDWLENLHDWLISKKRYWGLALPIWECIKCNNFEVVGGYEELKNKAVEGWEKFKGNSPHRPWIDQIKLKCSKCGSISSRVPDVGNPWLDAGIVPYSTITPKAGEIPSYLTDKKYWNEWFPPDFSVEMYEQTRLWFYAMIAMSSTLEEKVPVKRIFGHGRVVDEKGEEMHNSKGNAIDLNEVFEKAGSDGMRWLFLTANPGSDVRFGYNLIDEIKRKFILILWNSYKFFVDYANLANYSTSKESPSTPLGTSKPTFEVSVLDKWILARLNEVIIQVNESLGKYDASTASRAIEDFVVADFSTWYIRRSRDRKEDCLPVMYEVLVTLSKLLAPFIPFLAEEMFRNLTREESVHLQDYPLGDKTLIDKKLIQDMKLVREIAEKTHAKRKEAGIKLRQPISGLIYSSSEKLDEDLEKILADEINVKTIEYTKSSDKQLAITLDTKITQILQEEGEARELIRQIQQLRKDQNLTLADRTKVLAPSWPKQFESLILKSTCSVSILPGNSIVVSKA